MSEIVSAFPIAGGIQVNRQTSETELTCQMVFPGDEGWEEAQAAADYYEVPETPSPPAPEDLREFATLSRTDFLLRCVAAGVISEADALEAAGGEIPASFIPDIDQWPAEDRFEAKLRWAALTIIDRNNPLILTLADQRGISAEALDAIFGIGVTP